MLGLPPWEFLRLEPVRTYQECDLLPLDMTVEDCPGIRNREGEHRPYDITRKMFTKRQGAGYAGGKKSLSSGYFDFCFRSVLPTEGRQKLIAFDSGNGQLGLLENFLQQRKYQSFVKLISLSRHLLWFIHSSIQQPSAHNSYSAWKVMKMNLTLTLPSCSSDIGAAQKTVTFTKRGCR